jgi:lipid-A-disaccharide synthase-like uncharacterized protein
MQFEVSTVWLVVGIAAQAMFSARFLYQWLISERRGRSVVPVGFWWLSVGGGILLLVYAVHRRDPVFIVGQAGGLLVYLRNLVLIARRRQGLMETDDVLPRVTKVPAAVGRDRA